MTTSQNLDTRMPLNKKNFLILGGAILGAAVLVITLVLIFLQPSGTASKLESPTFTNITDVVTVGEIAPANVVIAPATNKWWEQLLLFDSTETLSVVDFSQISENAVYVAYTVSGGGEFQSYQAIGLPTHFIVYKDNAAAIKASYKISSTHDHVVADNMVIFIPTGAYSDVDYDLEKLATASSEAKAQDLSLEDKAMWQINIGQFKEIYLKDKAEEDIKTFNDFLELMGLTDETTWVGYSANGLKWEGKFFNTEVTEVPTAAAVQKFFLNQQRFVNPDGSVVSGDDVENASPNATGIPRQSMVLDCCLIVSDNNKSIGNISTENGTLTQGEPLTEKQGLLKVEMLSNQWLALMLNNTNVYPVSKFDKVEFLLKNMNGDSIITLSPLEP